MLPDGHSAPPAISIGPVTTAAARSCGMHVAAQAHEPTVEALALAVEEHLAAVEPARR
jgi:uroporphyrinogen-III synthase